MMRAIRDNEVSARAMGKNVTQRHLAIFVLGSAVLWPCRRDDGVHGRAIDAGQL